MLQIGNILMAELRLKFDDSRKTHAQTISRSPIVPEDIKRLPPGRSFTRAAFAIAKNALDGRGQGAHAVAEQRWPSDRLAIACLPEKEQAIPILS